MSKLYFLKEGDELCHPKEYYENAMRSHGWTELTVLQAEPQHNTGFFWCRHFGEIGEIGEVCGKSCKEYDPRNGRSGACKDFRLPMTAGKEVTLKLPKIITPVRIRSDKAYVERNAPT